MKRLITISKSFYLPLLVLFGILLYLLFSFLGLQTLALATIILIIILGSYDLFADTATSLIKGRFALDYIAILAIAVSFITKEYLVGAVIALMIATGRTLEDYGVAQAKKTLTKLIDRIPNEVIMWKNGKIADKKNIDKVEVGEEIFIRKGEVIGLDGILISKDGLTDESSLTGEPYTIEKIKGDIIRSGTINVGNPIAVRVTKAQIDSTYRKIIEMVKRAEGESSPLVRLADKYSGIFTIITFAICAFAFYTSGSLERVLAVLVIATPCPLILATPIALMGGVSAAAKKRIIVKKLATLEALSKANAFIFDKTGTITLGKPSLSKIDIFSKDYSRKDILSIAGAIERNSLHPIAKAVVQKALDEKAKILHPENVTEVIGKGITGEISGKEFTLSKEDGEGMSIALFEKKNGKNQKIASLFFDDEIKQDSKQIIENLKKLGLEIYIFTGDKKVAADKIAAALGNGVTVKAECTPQDKQDGIELLKKDGKVTVMVGDGINDAPALALADIGIVFSNEEQTAASEAADIVFLGNDFKLVDDALNISKKTIRIALQSIKWGIGLSVVGMLFASGGFIPPIFGAGIQEAIDIAVIINALRASKSSS